MLTASIVLRKLHAFCRYILLFFILDQTKQSVTSLEHHLKRSNNSNQRSQKEVQKALNSAKTLRHQIKILEARVEKQRKVISQTEEERNHYLQESTEQVLLTY